MKKIAIFASGTGSNAGKIIEHFRDSAEAQVVLVISNKKDAGVLDIAHKNGIPTHIIDRRAFYESETLLDTLRKAEIDLIVLAGFLWLIPAYLVRAYEKKIINIHPALLPKYGGKGMYGMHVHEAVKASGETESGITIHFVNEHYDEGDIILQERCTLSPQDSPTDIARKVLQLEHRHFPEVVHQLIRRPG